MKKRTDGMYERKIWIPQPDGSKKRQSFYDFDKRLLDIRINEIQNQINKNTYILSSDSTFEQNIKKWQGVHTKSLEETTKESYNIYVKHAIKLLGNKKLQEIKPSDIKKAYSDFLKDDNGKQLHSENSLKHLHVIINASLEFALEDKLIYRNPCDTIHVSKTEEFKPYVYTEDEFKKLMDVIKGTETEVIVLLAGGVGLRAGEICGLKWDDLDYKKNTISISRARYRAVGKVGEKKPKSTNSTRVIAVDPYILDVIKSHVNSSEYVLCRSTNNPYRNDEIYRKFVGALTDFNLPKTRLHDLRHYNATMMAFYEVDIKTAAERLGDNVVTVLKIYQHTKDEMNRKAAEKLGNMFKDKSVVTSVVNEQKEKDFNTTHITENPLLN
jgi:integrase